MSEVDTQKQPYSEVAFSGENNDDSSMLQIEDGPSQAEDDDQKIMAHSENEEDPLTGVSLKLAAVTLGVFQVLLLLLYAVVSARPHFQGAPADFTAAYNLFLGVAIMMFVGFGYLMTFLAHYGMGSVSLTMIITALGIQWALLTEEFFHQCHTGDWVSYSFDMYAFIGALYAVAAVLISFGGVIGKLTPFQIVLMTIIEIVFFSFNGQLLLVGELKVVDIGGTIIIHMFGAYFGLGVAYVFGNPDKTPKEGYVNALFAYIGTLFLWIYWPSFVAGLLPTGGHQQQRAVIATVLALSASTMVSFCLSSLLNKDGKFRPVDLQNATLAGGVAIGSVADLTIDFLYILIIGAIAGAVSTWGFARLQCWLEEKWGIFDTCGINNLHGMPSIVGGLASVIVAVYNQDRDTDSSIYTHHNHNQAGYQLAAVILTLGMASFTGVVTGWILKKAENLVMPKQVTFEDAPFFEKAD